MSRNGQISLVGEGWGEENVKSRAEEWLEAFEGDFWPEYPRRVGRVAARRAWLAVKPWNQETCDAIAEGLGRWLLYWEEQETEPRFIPHPSTWLNQRRWEEEPQ